MAQEFLQKVHINEKKKEEIVRWYTHFEWTITKIVQKLREQRYRVTPMRVSNILKSKGVEITTGHPMALDEYEHAHVVELRKKGWTMQRIAEHYDVHPSTIRAALDRMGYQEPTDKLPRAKN